MEILNDSLNVEIAAATLFVGGHFLLSSLPLRNALIERLGSKGFRILFSLVMAAALTWLIISFAKAPQTPLWTLPHEVRWVTLGLMLPAVFLVVAGLTTKNPAASGGEGLLEEQRMVFGIVTITRHPYLWGVALWAFAHLLVAGRLNAVILMGSLLLLCLGGMWHIDQRRLKMQGSACGPFFLKTSVLPFVAVLSNRVSVDWSGIGWWRPLVSVVLWVVLVLVHGPVVGLPLY